MHLLEPVLARSSTATSLYWATWPLRVPVFVLVAGYFSDARPLDDRRIVVLLRNVLGVYLMWDLVAFLRRGIVDDLWRYEPAYPAFGLWFLLALLWWRLMLPLLVRVRGAGALVWVLALGAGFVPQLGQAFAGSRTFVYLPLFWLGWRLRQRGARGALGTVRARAVGAVGLAVAGGGMLVLSQRFGRGVLRFAGPYGGGWEQQLGEAGLRGLVLVLGTVGALGALALVPVTRVPWWTTLGAGSMTVYVVHPVLVQHAKSVGVFDAVREPADLVALVVVGVGLALVLASPPVRAVLRPLVQPRGTWWLAPPPGSTVAGGAPDPASALDPAPAPVPAPALPKVLAPSTAPLSRGRPQRSAAGAPPPRVVVEAIGQGAADAAVPPPDGGRGGRVLGGVVRGGRGEACDECDELEVVGCTADDADAREVVVDDAHVLSSTVPQSSSPRSRLMSRLMDHPSTV